MPRLLAVPSWIVEKQENQKAQLEQGEKQEEIGQLPLQPFAAAFLCTLILDYPERDR